MADEPKRILCEYCGVDLTDDMCLRCFNGRVVCRKCCEEMKEMEGKDEK